MNGPIDEKSFDEYLQRGSLVSQQYRALDGDEVPPELDERILARASDAVRSSKEKARTWRRWGVPVGLAASVVLVASVVLEGVRHDAMTMRTSTVLPAAENDLPTSAVESAPSSVAEPQRAAAPPAQAVRSPPPPARAAAPERPAPRAQTQAQPADRERFVESSRSEQAKSSSADSAAQRDEIAEQPLQASAPERVHSGGQNAMTAERARRSPAAAPPRALEDATPAALEARAIELERRDSNGAQEADQWLERIRELRRAGKRGEADREWHAFLKAYPYHRVDEDDEARPYE